MLERIRRIVIPDDTPRLRVSPWGFMFVLLASVVLGCGLNYGSQTVAAIAVKALTHEQRVATIQEEHDKVLRPEEVEQGTATIYGKIITEDGGAVSGGWLYSHSERSEGGSSHSHSSTEGSFSKDFRFEVPCGNVRLLYYPDNYAPAIVGPFAAHPNSTVQQDIRVIKGQSHTVEVRDAEGNPLPGAQVTMYPEKANSAPVPAQLTNDEGMFVVRHTRPAEHSHLKVSLAGFNPFREKVLNNGRTVVTLIPSPKTHGRVVDWEGNPVKAADVVCLNLTTDKGGIHINKQIAVTDEDGCFETNALASDGLYSLKIQSDTGWLFPRDVAGGSEVEFELEPTCNVEITLRGDLSLLGKRRDGKIYAHGYAWTASNPHRASLSSVVDVTNVEQTDDFVRLTLRAAHQGEFRIRSGDFKYRGRANAGPTKVNVQVGADAENKETGIGLTNVVVRFELNGQQVKPGGELRCGSRQKYWPLEDGLLRMQLLPGKRYLKAHRMIGFTFNSQYLEVPEQSSDLNLTIDVQAAGAVAGTIRDSSGNPIETYVTAHYTHTRPGRVLTGMLANQFNSDVEGRFLLTPIPLGAKVFVKAGERFNPAISEAIHLDEANPKANIDLAVEQGEEAWVKVIGPDGEPLAGIPLSVRAEHPDVPLSWGGSLETNANGVRQIEPIDAGLQYEVIALPKREFLAGRVAIHSARTATLQLERGHVVKGKVVDSNGAAVEGVMVYGTCDNSSLGEPFSRRLVDADSKTDFHGEFIFTRLEDREVTLRVRGKPEPAVVVTPGAEPTMVQLTLEGQ